MDDVASTPDLPRSISLHYTENQMRKQAREHKYPLSFRNVNLHKSSFIFQSEEIFLDMFEDEWGATSGKPLPRIDLVLSDASLLLPPTGTPLTGIDFTKRLPCG